MAKITLRDGENDFLGAMIFQKRVKMVLEKMEDNEPLTINLNDHYIDSTMLGTLLSIHMTCRRSKRSMTIENVSDQTSKIMSITGLSKILFSDTAQGDAGFPPS